MQSVLTLPTHLPRGVDSHTLQHTAILDVFGGSQSIVLTPSVTIRKCACGCELSFITTLPSQKYIDNSHRQKAYRSRKVDKLDTIKRCLWCDSLNMPKAKTAKFCCASHRTMSYRKQRKAMLTTFAEFSCVDIDTAHEIVDRVGAKKMRLVLEDANYRYDYLSRCWLN